MAYVFSLNFKNFNPFVEAGLGATVFSPLQDFKNEPVLDAKRNTRLGGLFGGGRGV